MLGQILRRALRRKPESDVDAYHRNGRRPWSRGYDAFKQQFTTESLADTELLQRFRTGAPLPNGFGEFLDERVVEYPWLLSRLDSSPARLLDAGSSLNHAHLLDAPVLATKTLTITTLAPERECHWQRGISYQYGDVRDLPFRDGCFDDVVCISTLEHVGKDNTRLYSTDAVHRENDADAFCVAARELLRVCKPGGRVFITVPFGRYTDFGWYHQFDAAMLQRLIDVLAGADMRSTFFRYHEGGWQHRTQSECVDAEGFDVHSAHGFDSDFAAASRAIAALEVRKGGAA